MPFSWKYFSAAFFNTFYLTITIATSLNIKQLIPSFPNRFFCGKNEKLLG